MNLHPMKLVTIICEAVLEERVVALLREAGAHVHMAFNVSGNGQQGECSADFAKTSNLQAQVIVKLGAGFIVVRRHAKWFASYAVVAYESEVCVLRPGKYYHAAK
jgi:hypothetical protein